MSAAAPTTILNTSFGAFPNPALHTKEGKPKTWVGHLIAYTKEANGTFRILQLLDRVCKAVSLILEEMGDAMSLFFCRRQQEVERCLGFFGDPKAPISHSRRMAGALRLEREFDRPSRKRQQSDSPKNQQRGRLHGLLGLRPLSSFCQFGP